jgi:glycosyltransferase involved in cell wall biosynthesis
MSYVPVSVVIPTYNSARFIAQALKSVLAQTTRPAEIIVVDDGSTDDTPQVLEAFRPHVRYIRQQNQGVSAARNNGVASATGEFVAFLDSDDVWHPRKIEFQIAVFARNPELGLLGTRCFDWPCATFSEVAPECCGKVTLVEWEHLAVRNHLAASSVVARRSVLQKVGPFDTTMQGPEDRDLWFRISRVAAVGNIEAKLTGYRSVQGSVSKQAARCEAGMLRILAKLDRDDVWGGRWLLRRKSYGYLNHSVACIYSITGDYGNSIRYLLKSMRWYPLVFRRGQDVGTRCERPKRLVVNTLRLFKLWPGQPLPDSGDGCPTALDVLQLPGMTLPTVQDFARPGAAAEMQAPAARVPQGVS